MEASSPSNRSAQRAGLFNEANNPWLRVLALSGDGLLACQRDGTIIWMNGILQSKLEKTPRQLTAEMMADIAQEPDSPVHDMALAIQEAFVRGSALDQEIQVQVGLGRKKHFELLVVPMAEGWVLYDKNEPLQTCIGCIALFRDITTIKNIEKIRRDFVANVSHELRTPLSVLKGYTETLLQGALDDPQTARHFLEVMERHANRLSMLVEDLLDLSRLESNDFTLPLTPMWLTPLLNRLKSMVQDSASKKNITLTFPSLAGLPQIQGHPASLEQVFVNLVDNAIKYTPEGGHITLTARQVGDKVEFSVSDNGIGIAAKHIPRLFERFYRVDKARSRDMGGTGLGLSIVKHIIQAHGCDIWVESEPGRGTTFFFRLKIAQPGSEAIA